MKTVPCEVCHKEPASSLSWFRDPKKGFGEPNGTWKVVGNCTRESEDYFIFLDAYFSSAEGALYGPEGWRDHLREKSWFRADDFDAAVARFQAAKQKRCPVCGAR